jgi:putative ABC transport system permease protein
MRVPLAFRNLALDGRRTLVAVGGIAFTLVLVFLQLGFHDALMRASTALYDGLDFDVLLVGPKYTYTRYAGTVPLARVRQALAVEGVARAVPLYTSLGFWRIPASGKRRDILTLGFRPEDAPFLVPELVRDAPRLSVPDTVFMDRLTRSELGPRDAGFVGELDWKRVTVTGQYSLGLAFITNGSVAMSDATWSRLTGVSTDRPSLGLVKVAPGEDPATVARRIERALDGEVHARTRAEIAALERRYWNTQAALGLIFGTGVVVASLAAAVISYQVLATDIATHLREYATLKALGYDPGSIHRVVVEQALLLSLGAWLLAVPAALGLDELAAKAAQLPIAMTGTRLALVLACTVAGAAACGLLATRKLRSADPAELF